MQNQTGFNQTGSGEQVDNDFETRHHIIGGIWKNRASRGDRRDSPETKFPCFSVTNFPNPTYTVHTAHRNRAIIFAPKARVEKWRTGSPWRISHCIMQRDDHGLFIHV